MPARPTPAALLALALSLLVHAALLGGASPRERARPTRSIQLAAPPPQPLPLPEPAATPPQAAAVTPTALPAVPPTPPTPATPAVDIALPAAPALRLAGPAAWVYQLRQGGQDGEARLEWQPQADGRYSLRLSRRIGERALPGWQSLGRLDGSGLVPQRFAQQRDGQDRQATNFDLEGGLISFSASPARHERPEGAQDRLSWWLQLAALVQAQPQPGGRWRLWVAGLRGELREWVFEAGPAEPGAEAAMLHLRRLPLGPQDPGLELWLDPQRGYWPVRLRQGDPEGRGFEIRLGNALDDVNS